MAARRDRSGKKVTTGKTKAINRANYKIGEIRRTQGKAAVVVTKSGKLREFMSNAPVKGTTRKVRDTAQRAELQAKGYSKRKSILRYDPYRTHPLIRNAGEQAAEKKYRENRGNPVPVKSKNKKPKTIAPAAFGKKPNKPRGSRGGRGMRGGGMRGGSGGGLYGSMFNR